MNNIFSKRLIFLLFFVLLLSACSQTSELEPTITDVPTAVPTLEPEPTPTETRIESGFYNFLDEKWSPIYIDEMTAPVFLPEEMVGGDMENFQKVQYGYFVSYSVESNLFTMRSKVMPGEIFRDLLFQLEENQDVICLPETIGDTPIQNITFMYSNGTVEFPFGNGTRQLNDFLPILSDRSYFVIELTEPVHAETPNLVSVVAAICPQ